MNDFYSLLQCWMEATCPRIPNWMLMNHAWIKILRVSFTLSFQEIKLLSFFSFRVTRFLQIFIYVNSLICKNNLKFSQRNFFQNFWISSISTINSFFQTMIIIFFEIFQNSFQKFCQEKYIILFEKFSFCLKISLTKK